MVSVLLFLFVVLGCFGFVFVLFCVVSASLIFALSSQCGIFTTMIVEGLQIFLEISCLSAIWISDDHNGSVSLQHKKT